MLGRAVQQFLRELVEGHLFHHRTGLHSHLLKGSVQVRAQAMAQPFLAGGHRLVEQVGQALAVTLLERNREQPFSGVTQVLHQQHLTLARQGALSAALAEGKRPSQQVDGIQLALRVHANLLEVVEQSRGRGPDTAGSRVRAAAPGHGAIALPPYR